MLALASPWMNGELCSIIHKAAQVSSHVLASMPIFLADQFSSPPFSCSSAPAQGWLIEAFLSSLVMVLFATLIPAVVSVATKFLMQSRSS